VFIREGRLNKQMKMMHQVTHAEISDSDWKSLYRVGGVAALIAGALFRRNLGAEIELFSQHTLPVTVSDWFALLQSKMTSVVMLQSAVFSRAAAYVEILAGAFDLAYGIAFAFLPGVNSELLAVCFIPAASQRTHRSKFMRKESHLAALVKRLIEAEQVSMSNKVIEKGAKNDKQRL
jgi:hypothetical protein